MAEAIQFDEQQIKALSDFDKIAPDITARNMDLFMFGALDNDLKGPLEETLPKGVIGKLRNSLGVEIKGKGINIQGRIFPGVPYAGFVEFGRGPGGVDVSEIMKWIRHKGLTEFAEDIIWSIRRKGTLRHRTGRDSRGQVGEWATVRKQAVSRIKTRLRNITNKIAAEIAASVSA